MGGERERRGEEGGRGGRERREGEEGRDKERRGGGKVGAKGYRSA